MSEHRHVSGPVGGRPSGVSSRTATVSPRVVGRRAGAVALVLGAVLLGGATSLGGVTTAAAGTTTAPAPAAVAQAAPDPGPGAPPGDLLGGTDRPGDPLLGGRDDETPETAPAPVDERAPAPEAGRSWSLWLGVVALLTVSAALLLIGSTTVAWTLHAWRTPDHLRATRFSRQPATWQPRVSLLVPGRHEEAVMGATLDRLAESSWADLEILAIVGHDDPGTHAVCQAAADRHPGRVRVVVDHHEVKNKPKALNTALPEVTGEIVGVFDAEDDVAVDLVPNIVARFEETGAAVVQGGVQLMNYRDSWFAMRNVLEYYFWFRSRLHFHAKVKFIPLGGNTVFFRTDVLRSHDGWDAECLAEDCEIGVRLSVAGQGVAVAYDPELVTREETPDTLGALIKQRTRWNQGFLQVLGKGLWRRLPSRGQRLLAWYTLVMPFLQAFSGLMIPVSVILILFAQVPTWVALLSFAPLVPALVTLAVETVALHEFGRQFGPRARPWDYLRLVLGTLPYQVLLAASAVRATVRHLQGNSAWEKTEHTGLHRPPVVAPAQEPVGAGAPVVIDLTEERERIGS